MCKAIIVPTSWRNTTTTVYRIRLSKENSFSDSFELICNALPDKIHLQLANSSSIRYSQLFPLPKQSEVYCNRGTSGIDGVLQLCHRWGMGTQPTYSLHYRRFKLFYDANALWNAYLKPTTRIIVINNHGGGIFRILPGDKDTPAYDTYFETVQQRSAKLLETMTLGIEKL